eukprot:455978_1
MAKERTICLKPVVGKLLKTCWELLDVQIALIKFSAGECLKIVIKYVPDDSDNKYLKTLIQGTMLQDFSSVRQSCYECIIVMILRAGNPNNTMGNDFWKRIKQIIIDGVQSNEQEVKDYAYHCLYAFEKASYQKAQRVIEALQSLDSNIIKQYKKAVSVNDDEQDIQSISTSPKDKQLEKEEEEEEVKVKIEKDSNNTPPKPINTVVEIDEDEKEQPQNDGNKNKKSQIFPESNGRNRTVELTTPVPSNPSLSTSYEQRGKEIQNIYNKLDENNKGELNRFKAMKFLKELMNVNMRNAEIILTGLDSKKTGKFTQEMLTNWAYAHSPEMEPNPILHKEAEQSGWLTLKKSGLENRIQLYKSLLQLEKSDKNYNMVYDLDHKICILNYLLTEPDDVQINIQSTPSPSPNESKANEQPQDVYNKLDENNNSQNETEKKLQSHQRQLSEEKKKVETIRNELNDLQVEYDASLMLTSTAQKQLEETRNELNDIKKKYEQLEISELTEPKQQTQENEWKLKQQKYENEIQNAKQNEQKYKDQISLKIKEHEKKEMEWNKQEQIYKEQIGDLRKHKTELKDMINQHEQKIKEMDTNAKKREEIINDTNSIIAEKEEKIKSIEQELRHEKLKQSKDIIQQIQSLHTKRDELAAKEKERNIRQEAEQNKLQQEKAEFERHRMEYERQQQLMRQQQRKMEQQRRQILDLERKNKEMDWDKKQKEWKQRHLKYKQQHETSNMQREKLEKQIKEMNNQSKEDYAKIKVNEFENKQLIKEKEKLQQIKTDEILQKEKKQEKRKQLMKQRRMKHAEVMKLKKLNNNHFKTWNSASDIVNWVVSLNNNKYMKYKSTLQTNLEEEKVNGIYLSENRITAMDVRSSWGINNDIDSKEISQHIKFLKSWHLARETMKSYKRNILFSEQKMDISKISKVLIISLAIGDYDEYAPLPDVTNDLENYQKVFSDKYGYTIISNDDIDNNYGSYYMNYEQIH